jgi:hypothetical protein
MPIIITIALVALTLAGPAQAQRTNSRPDTSKVARQDHRGTLDSPLVVKVMPLPLDQSALARDAEERRLKAASDEQLVEWTKVLGVATIALVIATIINLLVLRAQGKDLKEQRVVMQRQADHLAEQATHLKASVLQAKDATQQHLRAYLVAKPGNLVVEEAFKGSYRLQWHPEIVNLGLTPAYDVASVARAAIKSDPLPPDTDLIQELDPKGTGSRGIIGTQQAIWPACDLPKNLSELELTSLKSGRSGMAWYVWGFVTYRDIFNKMHRTEYCNLADWDSDGKPISRCAPQHNTAD